MSSPTGSAIFFLRNEAHFGKGQEQVDNLDFYFMPTGHSLIVNDNQNAAVPLTEDWHPIAKPVDQRPFSNILQAVREYGAKPLIPVDLLQIGEFATVDDLVDLQP